MSEIESSDARTLLNPPGFCMIAGCSSPSVASRWIVVGSGEDREIEVCWKHAEGDLEPESIPIG
jgi:hypothetical protein